MAASSSLNRPRILYLSATTHVGGAEISLLNLLEALDRTKFEPIVVCPGEGRLAELLRRRGIRVEILPLPGAIRGARRLSFSFWNPYHVARAALAVLWTNVRLFRFLRRENVVLLHANSMKADLYASPVAWISGVPIVWEFHDLVSPEFYGTALRQMVIRFLNAFASCVIARSRAIRTTLIRYGSRPEKVLTIHGGINLDRFRNAGDPDVVRRELGLGPHHLVCGIFARLSPWKGHKLFLEAAARVRDQVPDARFVIAGESAFDSQQYLLELHEMTARLGLIGEVRFLGFREDVPSMMRACDLVVSCSVLPEPYGLTPLEAGASERAVVAPTWGGCVETVLDEETGVLVPPGDARALAEAILHLLEAPGVRARLGHAGRERVEALFNSRAKARAVESVYISLLK